MQQNGKPKITKTKAGQSKSSHRTIAETSGVQVISRAAQILKMLASARGLSISMIAEEVGLSRSTVYRILSALEFESLVVTNGPGGYRIGPAITEMAEAGRATIAELLPHMRRLSAELKETVDLSILTGNSVTFIEHVVAPRRLQAVSAPGLSFPLHCTANGKAMLATLSDSRIRELLPSRLEKYTGNTCLLRSQVETEIADVRRRGYALDREEHTAGICAVGATFQVTGQGEFWAISVPLPSSRFYGHENQLVEALLRETARIRAEVSGNRPTGEALPAI